MDNARSSEEPRTKDRTLPVLSKERREFPARSKQPVLQEVDESGDVIFRFKLGSSQGARCVDLDAFYRETLHDLLRVVRLYSGDRSLLVDGFAFLNDPDTVFRLKE